MNQRLEELARQAGLESFYVEYSPWQVEFENFAELIVRECMSLADLPNNTTGQWDHLSPSEVIANYFGVES